MTPFLPDVEADLDVEGRLPDARPHLVVVARVEEPVQDGGYLERVRRVCETSHAIDVLTRNK